MAWWLWAAFAVLVGNILFFGCLFLWMIIDNWRMGRRGKR